MVAAQCWGFANVNKSPFLCVACDTFLLLMMMQYNAPKIVCGGIPKAFKKMYATSVRPRNLFPFLSAVDGNVFHLKII